mmetsp:Transcript_68741/g.143565  ORF Transcript_68741/g.143565 Transcript_68741/m.143565 type:complete len:314 (+) Transcript_68741:149-1090(+)
MRGLGGARIRFRGAVHVGRLTVHELVQASILPVLVDSGSHHELDEEEDKSAHESCVSCHGHGGDELRQQQLEATTVEEPTLHGKAARQHGAEEATNAVAREGVQAVVDARGELEEGVDHQSSDDSHGKGTDRGDEASSGSDDDEAHDSTGHRADGRPSLADKPLHQHPSDQASRSCLVGIDQGQGGCAVGRQGRASVEAGPSKPEEGSTQDDEGDIVRRLLRAFRARTQQPGQGEGGDGRALVHNCATSEILGTELLDPTTRAPDPMGDGRIHHQGPQGDEDSEGTEVHSLHDAARDDGTTDNGKGHLKNREN